jgi:alkanesulfonate monooxygenase SsuD/methylene tetrahydromethanopterin reductase-like flavin-dependent oxidoreductase (luciferase family)
MRVGLTLALPGVGLKTSCKIASQAESLGFDTLSVGEYSYDVFAAAAAVAAATERVRLLAGVATWARPPVLTATSAVTVDELSGGRFVLGIGTMPAIWNENHYGITYKRPLARMREYVEAVRCAIRAHTGRTCDFSGEFFQIKGFSRSSVPLRDDIPIYLGATRPGMAALAGEIADGAFYNVLHTTRWLADVLIPATSGGELSIKGRRDRSVLVCCALNDDEELAIESARRTIVSYLGIPYLNDVAEFAGYELMEARRHRDLGDLEAAIGAVPEAMAREMCLVGTPAQCRAQLTRYDGIVDEVVLTPPRAMSAAALSTCMEQLLDTFSQAARNRR